MILEVTTESIRDVAAAVHSAKKREPGVEMLRTLERKVMEAIQTRQQALDLEPHEAQALRNVLLYRAWDQRNTGEGQDYADLAERIRRDLEIEAPPLVEAPKPGEQGG